MYRKFLNSWHKNANIITIYVTLDVYSKRNIFSIVYNKYVYVIYQDTNR